MFLLQDQVCNETNADLVIVNSCPENTITFKKRSNEKQCETKPNCLGKTLVYHCVKCNENLVEVCAPSSPIVGECSWWSVQRRRSACLSINKKN